MDMAKVDVREAVVKVGLAEEKAGVKEGVMEAG